MDKDLDDLLDSALGDFGKKVSSNQETIKSASVTIEKTNLYVDDIDYDDRPANPVKLSSSFLNTNVLNPANKSKVNNENLAEKDDFDTLSDEMKLFEQIFNDEKTKESMKQFTEAFSMFKGGGDELKLMENFQKVMSELKLENSDDEDENPNFNEEDLKFLKNLTTASTSKSTQNITENKNDSTQPKPDENKTPLNKVLDDLNKNSEKVFKDLQSDGFPFGGSEFLSSLISGNGNDQDLDDASSLMMEPILSMLFSKDILYPSLEMMLENYNKYIEENKEKLSQEELKKLNDQLVCIKEMCSIYQNQKQDDSKEVKSEQLKKILDLLEKCGMPPSELVPEVNPFEALGENMKPNGCPMS